MSDRESFYFWRRYREARKAARNADHAFIAAIHDRMADQYEKLAKAAEAEGR